MMICKYWQYSICQLTGYECGCDPIRYHWCCYYKREKGETKMESKYEYVWSRGDSINPAQVAKHDPPAKEFGAAVLWFYANKCKDGVSQFTIDRLVDNGKFTWLDWLVEKGFATRTKKRKLTIDDMRLETCSDGVVLRCANKSVLVFSIDGTVERVEYAKNELIPTDKEGRIIIK